VFFKRVDLHRYGRLSDEELLSSLREAKVLGYVVEDFQVLQIEVKVHESLVAPGLLSNLTYHYAPIGEFV
jgi:hypothetical protein